IDFFLDEHVPISPEMVAMIFFHETSLSDARQLVPNSKGVDVPQGPGIGFGQIEVKNDDKPAFFKAVFEDPYDAQPYDADAMNGRMLKDYQFAIKVHCEYLKHLHGNGCLDKRAILSGQFGALNSPLVDIFCNAEMALQAALYQGNRSRKTVIDALNACR